MKTKYFFRNIVTGIFGRLIIVVLALILPKLVIENYGSEVNGVVSSLMSFAMYLSLLEAGIGFASIQALYSLVPHKKYDDINAILSATSKYHRRNGVVYLIFVVGLAIIYPLVVKSTLPFMKIFLMTIFLMGPNLMIFFVQGRYSVMLTADNKSYIANVLATITGIAVNLSKVVLIVNGFSITFVLALTGVLNIANAIALSLYVKKRYSFIDFNCEPNYQAISKKNDVMAFNLLNIVMRNVDVALLTFFVDIKLVSVYALYNMIVTQVLFIPNSVAHSISTSMGQLYYENLEKFKKVYDCYETYYLAINFSLFIALYVVIVPFITLYTANITDINYVDPLLALLIVIIPLQEGLRMPASNLFFWVGHYDKLKKYAIVEVIANITLSVILIQFFKVYGVLIATSISMSYFTVISARYVYRELLHSSVVRLVRKSIIFIGLSIGIVFVVRGIQLHFTSFGQFFISGIVTFIICSAVYFIGISSFERQSFKTLLEYIAIFLRHLKVKVN